ncbi:MAG TPA: FixH family protein [Dehalococcoidia bacterium]|nr:FixH family protein [Dehalococcoidia bacterium]
MATQLDSPGIIGARPSDPPKGDSGRAGNWKRRQLVGAGILVALVVVLIGLFLVRMSQPPPADLDLSTVRLSTNGQFRASFTPRPNPIQINRVHTWSLHVETPTGQPIDDAVIAVDGDMPQHGHGLPTQPRVTQNLGDGDYLVEGMKFQMGGWWVVDFEVTTHGQTDTVRFNLMLS